MYLEHWKELIRRWQEAPRGKVLDEILRGKGVPVSIRPQLWLVASGGASRMERFKQDYKSYCQQFHERLKNKDKSIKLVELQIRKDVKRTYPLFHRNNNGTSARATTTTATTNGFHGEEDEKETGWKKHEKALYNVLCAVSLCVQRVNYHQGLNYVSALLLISLHDQQEEWECTEEKAFWVLVSLLNDYYLRGLYEHRNSFLQQYLDQFDLLVRRFLPRLHRHFEMDLEPGFPVVLFAVEWFTTVFSYSLRLDAVYLVWDLFLVARLDEALYVVGLSILFALSKDLLKIRTFEEMVDQFKHLVKNLTARQLREAVCEVTQRIIPSALIPRSKNTLALIERAMNDSGNVLNTADFNATRFVESVQVGDAATVEKEMNKYKLPIGLLEAELMRATFLGFPSVVKVLIKNPNCDPSCRSSLSRTEGLTPLHVCAITGNPTVARLLLAAGVDRSIRCYMKCLDSLLSASEQHENGYTAADLAQAVMKWRSRESAVYMVLRGDVCLCCGSLLERKENRDDNLGGLSKLWEALKPDWDQAVKRAPTKEDSWEGEYCDRCSSKKRGVDSTILDVPCGELTWHCMHCKNVTLGARVDQCKRCFFHFCGPCSFTRRRLLPQYKVPVPVCQNCHHFLRSCPCQVLGDNVKCFDVVCEHSAVDYLPFTPVEEGQHQICCQCRQCLKRRYSLKSPAFVSKPVPYTAELPMYGTTQAINLGYWGHGDRSILSVHDKSSDELLLAIQQIEDLAMSRMKYSVEGVTVENGESENEKSSLAAVAEDSMSFRDYRAELVEFYTMWNPSQLSKVDTILAKYTGQEEKLLHDLQKMYASY